MEKIELYSKKTQTIIRLISLLAIIILIISNIRWVIHLGLRQLLKSYMLYTLIINFISIILFLLVFFFPSKLTILSIVSFLYSTVILIFIPDNNLGVLMYGLSVMTLYARGILRKHKRKKEIIILVVFFILVFSEVRFGKEIFLSSFIEKMAFSFVFIMSIFFFKAYAFDIFETDNSKKKLDIQKFPELKKRDAEWLAKILYGEKYEYLAINYKMSLGSVKNRLKMIYAEIGVGDKLGFLNKYSDYEICFGDIFSSIDTNNEEVTL